MEFCRKTQFPNSGNYCGKQWLCGNSAFPRNFHTRKLAEITVFYAVTGSGLKIHKTIFFFWRSRSKIYVINLQKFLTGHPQMHFAWDSGFFPLCSEPPSPPSSLADLAKSLIPQDSYEKSLNAKSNLKQIQNAQFHQSFN